ARPRPCGPCAPGSPAELPALVAPGPFLYHTVHGRPNPESRQRFAMSIDKSLRRTNTLQRARNVLTRGERIKVLMDLERWEENCRPLGPQKTRGDKSGLKRAKKAKKEKKTGGEGEAAAAAPPAAEKKYPGPTAPARGPCVRGLRSPVPLGAPRRVRSNEEEGLLAVSRAPKKPIHAAARFV